MKKRLLIFAVIFAIGFVGIKLITKEKKVEIVTDDGRKYFVSYVKGFSLHGDDYYDLTLYDEHCKRLCVFSVYDNIPTKAEIRYDGMINGNSFYRMSVFAEKGKYGEWLWYETEGNFNGGGTVIDYMIIYRVISLKDYSMFDDMKGYALKKINEGEYGWLYSYGEGLIDEGHTEFIALIENILKDNTYSLADYCSKSSLQFDDKEFYSRCEEILAKYK